MSTDIDAPKWVYSEDIDMKGGMVADLLMLG